MESAFGVEHGDISKVSGQMMGLRSEKKWLKRKLKKPVSKGLKPANAKSLARVMTGAGRSSGGFGDARSVAYSRARLGANKKGAQAAIAKPGNRDPRGNPAYSPTSNGFKIANRKAY